MGYQTRPAAAERSQEIILETRVSGVEQLASRDHHEICGHGVGWDILPEDLSYQALSSISRDAVAKLAAGDNSKPRRADLVRRHDQGEKAPLHPRACIEHLLEFGPPSYAAGPPETLRLHGRADAGAVGSAYRQGVHCGKDARGVSFPTTRSGACGPSRGVA